MPSGAPCWCSWTSTCRAWGGLEFLEELRADPELTTTVVFVLTTSKLDEDRTASYAKHVAGYVVKTELEAGFLDLAELLQAYWRVVELP